MSQDILISSDTLENTLNVDINRVFIPCRPILELEVMSSILLIYGNYKNMEKVIQSNPNPKNFCKLMDIKDEMFKDIVDRYYNVHNRLKPIEMRNRWQKTSFRHRRMGSVDAYSASRVPLFFALDRFKIKYLLIKNFLYHLAEHKFDLSFYKPKSENVPLTVKDYLNDYYFHSTLKYFDLISPKKTISRNTRNLFTSRISSDMLRLMLTYVRKETPNSGINFMMRGIKSSLFVSKFLFMKLDVPHPFAFSGDHMIDGEKIMIGTEFLPDLLINISDALEKKNFTISLELLNAFEFMMERVLKGINNAVAIASNDRIHLGINGIQYSCGGIFKLE
ncbi:hypothetical protein DSAG12_03766 [Promethearchaeum syntrophicum]|uniref:Uncharacterized protein n=1 Tax=Promethearchaeum syntrophicum TaxID=2594042 RepID=A0A5B9DF76_9ARCH|nr:hypothetical protein [Candidatus Prometheoarchaeum syntrophicum]QEE17928.1 hypothetical protein DSAG12_03766 [Candidatus Prometheoarchaeum syntrophicum]